MSSASFGLRIRRSGHRSCRLVLSLPISTLRRPPTLSTLPSRRVPAILWPENWPERSATMTKPNPPRTVDQLSVQHALRAATRRCAIWGRDHVRGTARPEDDEFVRELMLLVRKYEKALPSGDKRIPSTDKDLNARICAVVEDFTNVIDRRNSLFGRVRPCRGLFGQLARSLRRHGCELTALEVRASTLRMLDKICPGEDTSDINKIFAGPDGTARACAGALRLDAGAGARRLHDRRKAAAALPDDRLVTVGELARYFLMCLSLGPCAAHTIAAVAVAAYTNDRLDVRFSPARELLRGFFGEPTKPRPAYPARLPIAR
jgi:hypothetical protein